MAKILAICTSPEKGTPKRGVEKAEFIADHGISGDAHAGTWHKQVSLLSFQKIEEFRGKGAKVEFGGFGENLVVDGIDFRSLPVGTILTAGKDVVMEITQIGKECHSRCAIYNVTGDCIMPREGVFAKVIHGGTVSAGDEMEIKSVAANAARGTSPQAAPEYRVWIITASDKGFKGEREDKSGPVVREIAENAGYKIEGSSLLADDREKIEEELKRICDSGLTDLIFTTGGTGLSPRDCMPEATTAVAHRLVPGIAEAMRAAGMAVTKRAMLSRSVCAIRGSALIINLPGNPKAARENLECVIGELRHGLDILTRRQTEH